MIPINFNKMTEQERIDWWKGLTEEQRQYIAGLIAGTVERFAQQLQNTFVPFMHTLTVAFQQMADAFNKAMQEVDWEKVNQSMADVANEVEKHKDDKAPGAIMTEAEADEIFPLHDGGGGK